MPLLSMRAAAGKFDRREIGALIVLDNLVGQQMRRFALCHDDAGIAARPASCDAETPVAQTNAIAPVGARRARQ